MTAGISKYEPEYPGRWSLRKRTLSIISAAIIALVVLILLPVAALAIPQPPHAFRGTVTTPSGPAPDALTITAVIAGATFPYAVSALTSGGRYGDDHKFKVPTDDPDTPTKEGGVTGDTVVFYLEGVPAGSYTFTSGAVTELNLSTNKSPLPHFIYTPESLFAGQEVTFDASASFDPDGAIVYYLWDFGDGDIAAGKKVRHTYSAPGNYTVVLRVEDNAGVISVEAKTITVTPPPPPQGRRSLPDPSTLAMVGSGLAPALAYIGLSRLRRRLNRG